MSPLVRADPDLLSSIILEGEVHEDAMPSGPFNPNPLPKPKKEKAEYILLTADLYPSAPNGVSVNVVVAGVQRKAVRLVGGAVSRLKSFLGGGGTIRVVSKTGAPVHGFGPAGVQFQEGCGGSCGVRESEAGAVSGRTLGALPSLSSNYSVGVAVGVERDVREVLSGIMADLALAGEMEESDSGYGENLGDAEAGGSDTVLITVCNCLEVEDGAGYIQMETLAADHGRSEQQDHDVCHMGDRF